MKGLNHRWQKFKNISQSKSIIPSLLTEVLSCHMYLSSQLMKDSLCVCVCVCVCVCKASFQWFISLIKGCPTSLLICLLSASFLFPLHMQIVFGLLLFSTILSCFKSNLFTHFVTLINICTCLSWSWSWFDILSCMSQRRRFFHVTHSWEKISKQTKR